MITKILFAIQVATRCFRPQTQVLENAAVSALNPLTGDLHQRLRRFYDESFAYHIRGAY
jgi:hypothetical protein